MTRILLALALLLGAGVPAQAQVPEAYTADEARPVQGRYTWAPGGGTTRQAGPLRVRVLGDAGPPVVLLHGVAGSGRYFGAAFDALADRARVIVPDLLGFGRSPKPATGYDVDAQVAALVACLDALGVREPAVVMGLSMGSNVAIRLAALHPDRVAAVIGVGPLAYRDRAAALRNLEALDPVTALIATDAQAGRFVCEWSGANPEASARIAKALNPALPLAVANDAVRPTYASFSQSLEHGVLSADVTAWIAQAKAPIRLLLGSEDPAPDRAYLAELAGRHPHLALVPVPGADHHVMLTHPALCVAELKRAVTVQRLARLGVR